ncbi:hypothetical protein llap_7657 [Limosa lapponica baueri]|uniref:Uncharacterized protein n=1 Tax=Limosa lapponica baueri TaxID=1758121 RepID=A0A2I0U7M0_LIMLA|nr:hypothetical protein llap_7657 [Limosa lapponica baueri]
MPLQFNQPVQQPPRFLAPSAACHVPLLPLLLLLLPPLLLLLSLFLPLLLPPSQLLLLLLPLLRPISGRMDPLTADNSTNGLQDAVSRHYRNMNDLYRKQMLQELLYLKAQACDNRDKKKTKKDVNKGIVKDIIS